MSQLVPAPRRRALTLAAWAAFGPLAAVAHPPPLGQVRSVAEASDYEQTSRHADVVAFLEAVAAGGGSRVHLTRLGYSGEGRVLPLAVWGAADASPEAVRATGKLRVYLQGNIHGGEVCGKEALLHLVRALALGGHDDWSQRLVLLVAPLYNPDGNERIDAAGRDRQHGPFAGVGQRGNAAGLDLNRDHVKLDSPEARAQARLWRLYDPHVYLDFHTTDGTYHAYHLTYAPPLHPSTDPGLVALLRGGLLPAVTARLRSRSGWESFYYGNLPPPHQGNLAWTDLGSEAGWYTFDHRPRFSNSYAGLRNRIGILAEAYAYLTFRERVAVSLAFAEQVLGWLAEHAGAVEAAVSDADAGSVVGQALALRATHARAPRPVPILLGAVAEEANPFTGGTVLRRQEVVRPVEVDDYGSFAATETEVAPAAYLVPPAQAAALDLLGAHGIGFRVAAADTQMAVERFRIDSTSVAADPYEGHRQVALAGAWEPTAATVLAGTALVPVGQPLGRLLFHLLEPRADDGIVAWDLVDTALDSADVYPILRQPAPRF